MNYYSDHFTGKIFLNPVPTDVMQNGAFWRVMKMYLQKHPGRTPDRPLGPFSIDLSKLQQPTNDLRVTWLGHSSSVLEMEGKRFLTDPLWYDRASPFKALGPKRFFPNPLPLKDLPPVDAIILSHDHYDHLDKQAILYLTGKGIPVITMLGVGKRLIDWGVSSSVVMELDWWQQHKVNPDFVITALPARHFSGRWINDRFSTLWGSFALKGKTKNVYYGADSGYFDGFKTIGEKCGPFDLAMLEIGAYNKEWISIHMGPESAVQAAIDVKADVMLPIHWATFNLAFHPWKEPVERVLKAAREKKVKLLLPEPGEIVEVNGTQYINDWWSKY